MERKNDEKRRIGNVVSLMNMAQTKIHLHICVFVYIFNSIVILSTTKNEIMALTALLSLPKWECDCVPVCFLGKYFCSSLSFRFFLFSVTTTTKTMMNEIGEFGKGIPHSDGLYFVCDVCGVLYESTQLGALTLC